MISDDGLNVRGVCGSFSVRIPSYFSVMQVKGKKDVILHATKATEMAESAKALLLF
jgi:hypothetical protein